MRLTSYIKVRVQDPGAVSVLSVAVDGKTVGKTDTVRGQTEIPVDTTTLANGNHELQVLAMTQSGGMIPAAGVPISVFN